MTEKEKPLSNYIIEAQDPLPNAKVLFVKDVRECFAQILEEIETAKSSYKYHTNCCFESHQENIKEIIKRSAGDELVK